MPKGSPRCRATGAREHGGEGRAGRGRAGARAAAAGRRLEVKWGARGEEAARLWEEEAPHDGWVWMVAVEERCGALRRRQSRE